MILNKNGPSPEEMTQNVYLVIWEKINPYESRRGNFSSKLAMMCPWMVLP
jgi:hypothetical protein